MPADYTDYADPDDYAQAERAEAHYAAEAERAYAAATEAAALALAEALAEVAQ